MKLYSSRVLLLATFLLLLGVGFVRTVRAQSPISQEWLQSNVVPLSVPNKPFSARESETIERLVGKARLVGLGESTHGGAAFYPVRLRIVQYLVEKLNFDTFALEEPDADMDTLSRFVEGENIKSEEALQDIFYWCWKNQEMVETVTWMRDWNLKQKANRSKRRIRVIGFDVFPSKRCRFRLFRYLEKYAPPLGDEFRQTWDTIRQNFRNAIKSQPDTTGNVRTASLETFRKFLEKAVRSETDAKIAGATLTEIRKSQKDARSLLAYLSYTLTAEIPEVILRDKGMADNILTYLQENPRSRAIVWAHNGHISKQGMGLGKILKSVLKERYVSVGTLAYSGSYTGLIPSKNTIDHFSMINAPKEGLNDAVNSLGYSSALIGLKATLPATPLPTALQKRLPERRDIGFYEMSLADQVDKRTLSEEFDALLFVHSTGGTHPLQDWAQGVPLNDGNGWEELDRAPPGLPKKCGFRANEVGLTTTEHRIIRQVRVSPADFHFREDSFGSIGKMQGTNERRTNASAPLDHDWWFSSGSGRWGNRRSLCREGI